MEEEERKDENYQKLVEAVESQFDSIVRDLDAALQTSWHAQFAESVEALVTDLESGDIDIAAKVWIDDLLAKLLAVAADGLKLPRELFVFDDGGEEQNEWRFENTDWNEEAAVKGRISPVLKPLVDKLSNSNSYEAANPKFLIEDIGELYSDLKQGLIHWRMGTPVGLSEAYFHWHLSPWHWNDHLFRGMYSLNLLRQVDDEV